MIQRNYIISNGNNSNSGLYIILVELHSTHLRMLANGKQRERTIGYDRIRNRIE